MRACLAILLLFFSLYSYSNEEIPGLSIEKIHEGVFLHKSFNHVDGFGLASSNGLVAVDDGKAFIVDTPWSGKDTQELVAWIKESDYELLGSVSTHSHEDRTAGIKWLNAHSIPTYASTLTNDILKVEKKALAKHAFKDREFRLANDLLEAYYPGGGHTIDNIVVWLPKAQILVGGCFVRSLESSSLGYTGEAHIAQWPSSVENVLSKYPDVRVVIPGHGKIGDIELLKHTKELAESASNKSVQPTATTSAD